MKKEYMCRWCSEEFGRYEIHKCKKSVSEHDIRLQDNVNKPSHYLGSIEVIDYIKDKLTPDQLEGYYLGNVLKYTSRYQKKNGLEDLRKAEVYLKWLINLKQTNANDYKCDQ